MFIVIKISIYYCAYEFSRISLIKLLCLHEVMLPKSHENGIMGACKRVLLNGELKT